MERYKGRVKIDYDCIATPSPDITKLLCLTEEDSSMLTLIQEAGGVYDFQNFKQV